MNEQTPKERLLDLIISTPAEDISEFLVVLHSDRKGAYHDWFVKDFGSMIVSAELVKTELIELIRFDTGGPDASS